MKGSRFVLLALPLVLLGCGDGFRVSNLSESVSASTSLRVVDGGAAPIVNGGGGAGGESVQASRGGLTPAGNGNGAQTGGSQAGTQTGNSNNTQTNNPQVNNPPADTRTGSSASTTPRTADTGSTPPVTVTIRYDDDIRAAMLSVLSRDPTRDELTYLRGRVDTLGSAKALRAELARSTESLRNLRELGCQRFNACTDAALRERLSDALASGRSLIELHKQVDDEVVSALRRLYATLLDRPADVDGLNYWIAQARNASLAAIETSMRASPEFQIRGLYAEVLGREPDAGGLRYWMDKHRDGLSLAAIRAEFKAADEAVRLAQGTRLVPTALIRTQKLVRDAYLKVLGRYPTVSEIEAMAAVVTAGSLDAAALRERLVAGAEGQRLVALLAGLHFGGGNDASVRARIASFLRGGTERVDVESLLRAERRSVIAGFYRAHLNREPDRDGLDYHLRLAEGGRTRAAVEAGISGSNEAAVRRLYRELLGREPDLMGLRYHVERMNAGVSLAAVRDSFLNSDEYRAR